MKYRVTYRQLLWTYMDVEAEDPDEAIEKGYDEIGGLCGQCSNAWGNAWQPTLETEEDSAKASEVREKESGNEVWSEPKDAFTW